MTVTSLVSSISFQGDGTTTSFPFPGPFFALSDLVVTLTSQTTGLPLSPAPALNGGGTYDYVVNGTQDSASGEYLSGGTVVFNTAPAANFAVSIVRAVSPTQQTSLNDNTLFPAKAVEGALDRITMLAQQFIASALLSITIPASDPTGLITVLPTASLRAGKILGFDSSGNAQVVSNGAQTGDVTLAEALAAGASVARSLSLHFADQIAVEDFGAVGDGITDDTAAIQAAVAGAAQVKFGAKTYVVSSTLTVTRAGQRLIGSGTGTGTVLQTNQATGDVLSVTANDVDVGYISFATSVARTAGSFINLNGQAQVRVHDFSMTGFYTGVTVGTLASPGNAIYVERGILTCGAASNAGVVVLGGVVLVLRDLLIVGQSSAAQPASGVSVLACGDLTLDHVETIYAGTGLRITPAAGYLVQALWVVNSFFDSGNGWGIYTNPSGSVQLLKIENSWSCSNTLGGVCLTTTGAGGIAQTDIVNTISSNNGSYGLLINSTSVVYTKCIGCSFSANNANGVDIIANVNEWTFTACSLGQSGEFGGNAGYGLAVGAGCTNFSVEGCFLQGNTSGALSLGAPTNSQGVSWWIAKNVGITTQNFGTLVTTAGPSSFVITHGLAVQPLQQEIVLNAGSGLGSAASFYVSAVTSTTFTISFNAAPGAGVSIFWYARSAGS